MKKIITILTILISFNFSQSLARELSEEDKITLDIIQERLENDNSKFIILEQQQDVTSSRIAKKFQHEEDIMEQLVKLDGLLLRFGNSSIIDNKKIVLNAVKENPLAIKFANKRLRKDRDVIYEAAIRNFEALGFVSKRITQDKDFILKILNNSKQIKND